LHKKITSGAKKEIKMLNKQNKRSDVCKVVIYFNLAKRIKEGFIQNVYVLLNRENNLQLREKI